MKTEMKQRREGVVNGWTEILEFRVVSDMLSSYSPAFGPHMASHIIKCMQNVFLLKSMPSFLKERVDNLISIEMCFYIKID